MVREITTKTFLEPKTSLLMEQVWKNQQLLVYKVDIWRVVVGIALVP